MPTPSLDSIELEFTFLAKYLPRNIADIPPKRLKDIYIPDGFNGHPRLRLRRKGESYEITKKIPVKGKDASVHTELTIPIEEEEFNCLEKSSSRIIEKDRYVTQIDGYDAEVDVFRGELEGLVLIDFEFRTESEKDAFVMPEICLADVTQEKFIAGGVLAGKNYADIASDLSRFNYQMITF